MKNNKYQRFIGIFLLAVLILYRGNRKLFSRPIIHWMDDITWSSVLWFMAGFLAVILIVFLSSKYEGKRKDRYNW